MAHADAAHFTNAFESGKNSIFESGPDLTDIVASPYLQEASRRASRYDPIFLV